jgi:ricin-type beta-trefoil lectin protein
VSIRRYLTAVAVSAVLAGALVAPAASASTDFTTAVQSTRLMNRTGLCLDGSFSAGVRMMACSNTSLHQQWDEGLNHEIYNEQYDDACLDGSVSQGVRLAACASASEYQGWIRDGRAIKSFEDPRYCLDGSESQGVRLQLCNGSKYQQWSNV